MNNRKELRRWMYIKKREKREVERGRQGHLDIFSLFQSKLLHGMVVRASKKQ
jgi:hypothetical protein